MKGYDVAQICPNGHVTNSSSGHLPEHNEKFCSKCGAETIAACPSCQAPIRGAYWGGMGLSYEKPSHCSACGSPYPWTSAAIAAANELAAETEISEMDRESLPDIIENLVRDTPRSTVAAARMMRILAKVKPWAAEGFKSILVDVITEGARKMIWPGP